MTFRKGDPRPPGSGRPRGGRNKTTQAVREALVEAFENAGGTDFLLGVARTDPATFCRLIAKLIPSEVRAAVESETRLTLIDLSEGRDPAVAEPVEPQATIERTADVDLRGVDRDLAPASPPGPVTRIRAPWLDDLQTEADFN